MLQRAVAEQPGPRQDPPLSTGAALRRARVFPLVEQTVLACLDPRARPTDALFETAFRKGLDIVPPHRRSGALSSTTGHVAEAVAETLLVDAGYHPVWHLTGPGSHGVDLILLGPDGDHLVVVEVKGTLRHRRWPRLTTGELPQMTGPWLDKADNPGMAEWNLRGADVYGAVVLIQFAQRRYKLGVTADFVHLHPIMDDAIGDLRAVLPATPS